ncbi:MAG: hypothetical protein IPM46_03510 [Flavobacteriales bacterium]|nr:hypothetical protein [Flavobacteriales bacterium]
MRRIFLAPMVLAAGLAWGQSEPKAVLIQQVNALAGAKSESARDSISELIKQSLRGLLDGPEGLALSLHDVPLSRVEAPDGSFKLITWNVPRDDGSHRYEGMLLTRSGKRATLFELRDMTRGIPSPELADLGPDRWYGALYYQVVPVKKGGKTWYTLLGWKGYDRSETRKVVEVLSFRSGKPRFGAPIFSGVGRLKEHRKIFGFAFQSTMMLRYEQDQARIVMDHLSPLRADMEKSNAFLGPDMSYDALVWEKREWRLVRDVDARDPRKDGKPFNAPPAPPRP